MSHRPLPRLLLFASLFFLVAGPSEARWRQRSRKSPHAEIVAQATVETTPMRKVHANHREFEEFDVKIVSYERAPEGDFGGDPALPVSTSERIHVVHDLSCGGIWMDARPGEKLELKGEYVHPGNGRDLIHFTHPSGGECGRGGGHPDGFLRKRP